VIVDIHITSVFEPESQRALPAGRRPRPAEPGTGRGRRGGRLKTVESAKGTSNGVEFAVLK